MICHLANTHATSDVDVMVLGVETASPPATPKLRLHTQTAFGPGDHHLGFFMKVRRLRRVADRPGSSYQDLTVGQNETRGQRS